MFPRGRSCYPEPPLQVCGEPIKYVPDLKYLGSKTASTASDFKSENCRSLNIFGDSQIIHLWENQLIQHHLCDHSHVWLWVCRLLSQDKRSKLIILQPLTIGSYWMSNKKTMSLSFNTINIYHTIANTEPLVYCVREHPLGLFGDILRLPLEELAKKCSLPTITSQKGIWTSMHLLPCLHPTCGRGLMKMRWQKKR